MKKNSVWALALVMLLAAVVLSGCGFGKKEKVKVNALMLIGRWEAPSQDRKAQEGDKLVFVFQDDSCVVDGADLGRWGYQFDEGNGVEEEDLLDKEEDGAFHKNGWFGWTANDTEYIRAAHMTSVGSAKTPYNWEVTAFSSTSMTLIDNNKTYTFTKVADK